VGQPAKAANVADNINLVWSCGSRWNLADDRTQEGPRSRPAKDLDKPEWVGLPPMEVQAAARRRQGISKNTNTSRRHAFVFIVCPRYTNTRMWHSKATGLTWLDLAWNNKTWWIERQWVRFLLWRDMERSDVYHTCPMLIWNLMKTSDSVPRKSVFLFVFHLHLSLLNSCRFSNCKYQHAPYLAYKYNQVILGTWPKACFLISVMPSKVCQKNRCQKMTSFWLPSANFSIIRE
jgi:hypothetical protein